MTRLSSIMYVTLLRGVHVTILSLHKYIKKVCACKSYDVNYYKLQKLKNDKGGDGGGMGCMHTLKK